MDQSRYRLLVAEDDDNSRFLMVRWLRRHGFKAIEEALDGRQALQRLQDEDFDLVLLDLMMPGLDGEQVLNLMRLDERLREVPVIVISALDSQEQVARCIEAGAEDYLTKPFSGPILRARINACLERRRLQTLERSFLRSHDPVTGLPNRTELIQRLDRMFSLAHRREVPPVALLRIDLDRLKEMEERLGPRVMDDILHYQARRLADRLDREENLFHCGPGQFALVCLLAEQEGRLLAHAREILALLAQPLTLGRRELVVPAWVGIAVNHGEYRQAEAMLRDAALAAGQAHLGEGCLLFRDELHHQALRELELEAALRGALARGELEPYYQPIVARDGRLAGFEALLRWHHDPWGMVPPGEFIPVAEETGLILSLGAFVLEQACAQAVAWGLGESDRFVSVNVAPRQLQQPDFPERVEAVLTATGLPPGALRLEITEGAFLRDPEAVLETMNRLRGLGVRWAVDDFGTGYSSLSYLSRLPLDVLKIDRGFVMGLEGGNGERQLAIVRGLLGLARSLGMTTVAEGVETADSLKQLRTLDCDYLQGFLLGRPLEARAATELLAGPLPWGECFPQEAPL